MIITADFSGEKPTVTTESLYQWDIGQRLKICGLSGIDESTQVHFANVYMNRAIVKEGIYSDGELVVDIPNEVLQYGNATPVKAWVYINSDTEGRYTIRTAHIPVTPRKCPNDYVSPEDPDAQGIIEQAVELLENYERDITGKVSKPIASPNGTNGQLLRTLGDGTTEWVNAGLPTDAQTVTAVSEWLDDHPEATTTVEDGAVTAAKIGSGAVTAAKLGSDVNTILDGKVIKPSTSPNGTNGQILRTKGDGTTEWVDVGLPTDAQTAAAVSDWLDDHPEATTTVEDGSVTLAKLHSGVIDSTLSTQGAAEAKATGNEIKADAALVAGESLITASLLEPYNATFTNVEYTTTANKTLMADGTIIDYNSGTVSNVVTLTPDTLYECNCGGIGGGGAHFFLYDSKNNISAVYPALTTSFKKFIFKATEKFNKIQFNVRGSGCYLRAITLNGLEVENNFIELTNHILDTVDYTGLNISFIYPKRIRNDGVIVDYPNGGDTWAVSNEIDISQYDYLKINACAGWGDAYFAVYDENHSPIYFELSPNSAPTIYNANIILPKNAHYLAIAKFGTRFDAYVSYPVFEAPTKKWEGKKWVCIGDSLTEANSATSKHYFDYIADETGITTANYGIGGTGYANPSGTAGNFTARMASVPTDADVYTIFGSFNDYAYSINNDIPIGTPEDSGTSTICGYINRAFDALFARVPLANLGVVAPCPWVSVNSVTGTTSKTFAENYVSALRQCCERKSIPFLDLYHGSGLRPWDSNFRDLTYTKDTLHGVHPDETGHAILAPKFSAFLDFLL